MTDGLSPRPEPVSSAGPFRRFWIRHRTLFWALHSVWAFATGVAVMLLARERYGFVPWVVLFLVLTWASTFFLGRRVSTPAGSGAGRAVGADLAPPPAEEFASYIMRGLYQETLFFLLPFYLASTVPTSINVVFVVVLAGLALLACLDLVFDRLIRTYPLFGFVFFATVAFAAVNLVLPILLPVSTRVATVVAAAAALGSSIPLALRESHGRERLLLALPTVVLLGVALIFPAVVPPAPLRLDDAVFASAVDRATVEPADSLPSPVSADRLDGALAVVMEVFAPSRVPAAVTLEWRRNGNHVRTTREISIDAHELGFRVWDAWRPPSGVVQTGDWDVTIRTADGRVFGRARIEVAP